MRTKIGPAYPSQLRRATSYCELTYSMRSQPAVRYDGYFRPKVPHTPCSSPGSRPYYKSAHYPDNRPLPTPDATCNLSRLSLTNLGGSRLRLQQTATPGDPGWTPHSNDHQNSNSTTAINATSGITPNGGLYRKSPKLYAKNRCPFPFLSGKSKSFLVPPSRAKRDDISPLSAAFTTPVRNWDQTPVICTPDHVLDQPIIPEPDFKLTNQNCSTPVELAPIAVEPSPVCSTVEDTLSQLRLNSTADNPRRIHSPNSLEVPSIPFNHRPQPLASPEWSLFLVNSAMKLMVRKKCSKTYIPPNVEYFLASLCDVRWKEGVCARVRTQTFMAQDVQSLLGTLDDERAVNAQAFAPKTNFSALKEILKEFPGGIFADIEPEMMKIPTTGTPREIIELLSRLINMMPDSLQIFSGLVFRGIRNLVYQCQADDLVPTYTDLLIHFTPTLFPKSLGDVDAFLQMSRLILLMIDSFDSVFRKLSGCFDASGNYVDPPTNYYPDRDSPTPLASSSPSTALMRFGFDHAALAAQASSDDSSDENAHLNEIMGCLSRLEDYLASEPEPKCALPPSPDSGFAFDEDPFGDSQVGSILQTSNSSLYQFAYLEAR